MAIIASDITDETNDNIVVNPRNTHAVLPNTHRCSMIVATVIGMLITDTSKSAKAKLRRKPLEIVRRLFLLVTTKNKVRLPRMEVVQKKTRMTASMISVGCAISRTSPPLISQLQMGSIALWLNAYYVLQYLNDRLK